jgi:hypothetical protein
MASSFTMTRNQIIKKALQRLQVIGDGDIISAEMYNSAAEDLNLINTNLNKKRKKLWTVEEGSAQLSTPDAVSNNDVDYYCIVPHTADADNEPGVGDDWKLYWYAGTVSLSETTPSAWALATVYTNGGTIELPTNAISIESAYLRNDDDDCPVTLINRFQEDSIFSKWETGEPVMLRFDRYAEPPTIQLYGLPDESGYILFYRYIRKLNDVTEHGQVPDVPTEWLDYLIYELASYQGEEYGVADAKIRRMAERAAYQLRENLRDQAEETETQMVEPCYD